MTRLRARHRRSNRRDEKRYSRPKQEQSSRQEERASHRSTSAAPLRFPRAQNARSGAVMASAVTPRSGVHGLPIVELDLGDFSGLRRNTLRWWPAGGLPDHPWAKGGMLGGRGKFPYRTGRLAAPYSSLTARSAYRRARGRPASSHHTPNTRRYRARPDRVRPASTTTHRTRYTSPCSRTRPDHTEMLRQSRRSL